MTLKTNTGPVRPQHGMTLIEVLVTLVVISVGLLGVAALQLTSLKGNQEAHVRSQASALASDILDRIRANALEFRSGQYDVAFNGTGTDGTAAGEDLTRWQQTIDSLLPGGAEQAGGAIARNVVGGANVVTITIRWGERADVATDRAAAEVTFQTRSEI